MVDASEEQGVARAAVMECEQEIQSIKAALRKLSAVDSGDPNSLEIVILKVRLFQTKQSQYDGYFISCLYFSSLSPHHFFICIHTGRRSPSRSKTKGNPADLQPCRGSNNN
jgi:hypothetical protein